MRCFALLLLVFVIPVSAMADERILGFHSNIVVKADGWIEVTENITVRAEGNRIRRGVYRDLPSEYWDKRGNVHIVSIEPLVVLRNDRSEDFHEATVDRGIRIYFGHRDRNIDSGVHTYQFRYRADRMLGFFESHDELYWNVTGFDWAFPIDAASATVSFEFDVDADDIEFEAYTGGYGSIRQDYTAAVNNNGSVDFAADKPLSAVNGLTIVVGWPKGLVQEPTSLTRFRWMLRDNASVVAVLAGLLLLWIYYLPVWRSFGKDPDEGVIVARYEPPPGYSPASLRYVRQMHYDNKVMTAAVVNLAVKGYVEIEKTPSRHTLRKKDVGNEAPDLTPDEQALYDGLFTRRKFITLSDENHEVLGAAKTAHRASLKQRFKNRYFETNFAMNLPGLLIFFATVVIALKMGRGSAVLAICGVVAMLLTIAFFTLIMRRPTYQGRKLLDQMLGFREYVEVAEKDDLNLRNPPKKTPQLFERYLPYALALGVDQAWSEKFARVLASVNDPNGEQWQPAWYSGHWDSSRLVSNTDSLSGGLNSAIASSVTPPASTGDSGFSSSGGGGGFSGGGGGGGGGGGW
jgi:uncharacterized membrane protein YgcG